jgi:hypothetical protein
MDFAWRMTALMEGHNAATSDAKKIFADASK